MAVSFDAQNRVIGSSCTHGGVAHCRPKRKRIKPLATCTNLTEKFKCGFSGRVSAREDTRVRTKPVFDSSQSLTNNWYVPTKPSKDLQGTRRHSVDLKTERPYGPLNWIHDKRFAESTVQIRAWVIHAN